MLVNDYKRVFVDAVLRLLWQQWCDMGVAGYAGKDETCRVLDPEALVLFSSAFCRYEPRLYDLIGSWMIKYSRLLNPPRLKSMARRAGYRDEASLAYLAALCVQAGDMRWKRAAAHHTATETSPLFLSPDNGAGLYSPGGDGLAQKYGFCRAPFEYQSKIMPELPGGPGPLLLHLRGLLGVSARAEVILLLLERARSIQQLSEASGFVRSAIKVVLDELSLSNLIFLSRKKERRNNLYDLRNKEIYLSMFGCGSICFPRWNAIYEALGKIWLLISRPIMEKVSDETFRGEMRCLFREELRSELLSCGVPELENMEDDSIFELPDILKKIG